MRMMVKPPRLEAWAHCLSMLKTNLVRPFFPLQMRHRGVTKLTCMGHFCPHLQTAFFFDAA